MSDDDPYAAFLAHQEAVIAEFGWSVVGVFPTPDEPITPFGYTVGLQPRYGFELVIVGVSPQASAQVLNRIGHLMSGWEPHLVDGTLVDGIGQPIVYEPNGYRMEFVPLPTPTGVNVARRLYGDVTAIQVLWPDDDHRTVHDDPDVARRQTCDDLDQSTLDWAVTRS